jgi:cytochrome P450
MSKGPTPAPFLGNLLAFGKDPLGFLTQVTREYGCGVKIRLEAERDTYVVTHPDHIEYVLTHTGKAFSKGYQRDPIMRLVLGNGLVTSEGDFWLRQRRLSQPAFHRQRIAGYGEVMVDYAKRMLSTWQAGQALDLHEAMMRLTLEIISKSIFDVDLHDDKRSRGVGEAIEVVLTEYSAQLTSAVRIILDRLPFQVPKPGEFKLQKAVEALDRLIHAIVAERRNEATDRGDLLSTLLAAQDEDGSHMNDEQLRDELVTLFLAGHETTANTLSWAFYLLAQHPNVEQKLLEEYESVTEGESPTVDMYPKLTYTQQVIKEAMRLYPPVWWVSREALQDWQCDDVLIPKGSEVGMSQWVMHRDPTFYEDPDAFRPERWTAEFERLLPRYAYFPFGGGPRLCIGNSFALLEVALILAAILPAYRLHLIRGQKVGPLPSITLRPKHGLRVNLERRRA